MVDIGAGQGSATARPLLRKAVSRSHAEVVHASIPTKIAVNLAPPPQCMEACKELSALHSSSPPIKEGHPLLLTQHLKEQEHHIRAL